MGLPNIIQQINSKLPLSGGTLTGRLNVTNVNGRSAAGLHLYSGDNNAHGANIQLFRNDHANYPGKFYIRASLKSSWDDTNLQFCDLVGNPNGTLTWGGNNVITSAGGTFAGVIECTSAIECASNKYSETTSNEEMVLSNYGINLRNSDIIGVNGLYFNDAANSYEEGINFPDGTNMFSTILATGGKLYFTPKRTFATTGTKQDVVCVTKWASGTSWYRKYADGWIEQGGQIGRQVTVTTNFNIAFTQIPTCICGCVYNRASTFYAREVYPNTVSTTAFTITNTVPAGSTSDYIKWYACGY